MQVINIPSKVLEDITIIVITYYNFYVFLSLYSVIWFIKFI